MCTRKTALVAICASTRRAERGKCLEISTFLDTVHQQGKPGQWTWKPENFKKAETELRQRLQEIVTYCDTNLEEACFAQHLAGMSADAFAPAKDPDLRWVLKNRQWALESLEALDRGEPLPPRPIREP
jgi:hypothetical protein